MCLANPQTTLKCLFCPSRCSSMFECRCVDLFLFCICFGIAFAFAYSCLFVIAVRSARDTQCLLNFAVFVVTFVLCCAYLLCLCVASCSSLAGHRGCLCIRWRWRLRVTNSVWLICWFGLWIWSRFECCCVQIVLFCVKYY